MLRQDVGRPINAATMTKSRLTSIHTLVEMEDNHSDPDEVQAVSKVTSNYGIAGTS
jgi:hypothetical protein